MSELNNDKKVLEDGRKNTLKDVDAPLRDQINAKLLSKLQDMEIGEKVVTLWNKGSYNRQRWLERQKAYLASWDEHLIGGTEGSFEGSSQLHVPMPFVVCKTLHARFMQALWSDPPFNVKARNEASIERMPTVYDVMRYYLMEGANYGRGLEAEADAWVWRWITNGSAILKMGWDRKYSRFVDVVEVPTADKPQIKVINGKEQVIPTTKMVEKEVAVTKKTFDGPIVRGVKIEDILIIGGDGDPDKAEAVIEQDWLTASDLWNAVDQKIFNSAAVEKIIESGRNRISPTLAGDLKNQRAINAGQTSLDYATDLDRYQIFEAYLQLDVDGSGINTDVVVWVHNQTREILRATYLWRMSTNGERPYAKSDFIFRDGQEFGVGMPEVLYPLSQELDAMHNMRIDFGLIATMPFGFYRASSGIDPETIKFEPGSLIPVDNPMTDVVFPNLGNRTVFGMQEEQAIQSMVERITSISDLNLGMTSSQGATRTATGSRALVGEMSSNNDVYLRRLNRGWKKVLRHVLHLLQKRMPVGLSFRLTGDDGKDYWRYIKSLDQLEGDFDIEISSNSNTSNPGIQAENADYVLQMASNPLAIQMGIVSAGQFYEAAKSALQARGIRDFSKFIQKPQGYDRILTPIQEMDSLLIGVDVPVAPNADHQGYLDLFDHFMKDDYLHGQFNEQQIALLAKHAKLHEQMMQAMQAAQAQAANAAQMQRNSQMAAPQAGGLPTQSAGPPQSMPQAGGPQQ